MLGRERKQRLFDLNWAKNDNGIYVSSQIDCFLGQLRKPVITLLYKETSRSFTLWVRLVGASKHINTKRISWGEYSRAKKG